MRKPKYHVFVCSSSRINGQQQGFCHSNDAIDIVQRLLEEIEDQDLTDDVMVTNTGCMGICQSGPVMVIYPEGIWYTEVGVGDVTEIVESHLVNGSKVSRLELT